MVAKPQPTIPEFAGFSKQTNKFLKGITANNDREWFEAHREEYMAHYVEPAQALVEALGPRLARISPGVQFNPNHTGKGSIKKIHQDLRFARNRPPFKTWLNLIFWQGPLKAKKDNSVFFMRLMPNQLVLGAGLKHFERPVLKAYREAVVDDKQGAALKRVLGKLAKPGKYMLPEPEYKKIPRGFDADHSRAPLLLNGSVFAIAEMKPPPELYSSEFVEFAMAYFKEVTPLHKWCVKMLETAEL